MAQAGYEHIGAIDLLGGAERTRDQRSGFFGNRKVRRGHT